MCKTLKGSRKTFFWHKFKWPCPDSPNILCSQCFGRSPPFSIRRCSNLWYVYDFYYLAYVIVVFMRLLATFCSLCDLDSVSQTPLFLIPVGWSEGCVFMHSWKISWRIYWYKRRFALQLETWSHVLDKHKRLFDVVPCSSTLQHCVVSILLMMLTRISCFVPFFLR